MRLIDVDQSGTVDYDEFIALVYSDDATLLEVLRRKVLTKYGHCSGSGGVGQLASAPMRDLNGACTPGQALAVHKKLREVFDSFDSRLDGELPTDAFGLALEHLDVDLSPDLVKQLLVMFDADCSGSIDFSEFVNAMMSPETVQAMNEAPAIILQKALRVNKQPFKQEPDGSAAPAKTETSTGRTDRAPPVAPEREGSVDNIVSTVSEL
jgi:hypothetical protein